MNISRFTLFAALAAAALAGAAAVAAPTPAQRAYLKASNTGADDRFGNSVAVSGDTMVIGALAEASNATGVNGNQSDNSAPNAGAAYVFVRSGTNWIQQAYLKASNTGTRDLFGRSVAVSGDTVVVGAPGESSNATGVNGDSSNNFAERSGAAYVFVRSGTNWSQQAYLKASNTEAGDGFGVSVAVSGDTVVVGAGGEDSNAAVVNGNQNDNSATFAGAGYVFVRSGTNWNQQAYLKASNTEANDFFGSAVAVAGDTVVVGAQGESSNAIGVNGDQNNNRAFGSGAAYVFVRSGTNWSQQAYLKASNTGAYDAFGNAVAVAGDTLVVGAVGESSSATGVNGNQFDNSANQYGAAYIFVRRGTMWSQQAYLKASNTEGGSLFGDFFGVSVAVSGEAVVVGARLEDSNATGVNGDQTNNTGLDSGAAYVFLRSGTNWAQQAYLKASNTGADDYFGHSVAVSGGTVVVGAYGEASSATGVNGNESDNGASQSGAAYVFNLIPPNEPPVALCQSITGLATVTPQQVGAGSYDPEGGPVTLTLTPAGPYPLGTNLVTLTVTDTNGLSSTCQATVTVLGPRGLKRQCLADLTDLRGSVTNRHDLEEWDDAIEHLAKSLAPDLWVDDSHLQRKHGEKVFEEEKHAVHELVELLKDKKSTVPDAVLQRLIDCIFQADRLLAVIAVDEAVAAGVNPKKIAEARKKLAEGDAKAGEGKPEEAIDHYKEAWNQALHATIEKLHLMTGGKVQLEILGLAGESYVIQTSTNLTDWVTLDTRPAGPDGVVTYEHTSPPAGPMRFYRILAP